MRKIPTIRHLGSYLGLTIFYFISHLIALTKVPVFADEAIYIRWSQLIIDDWRRYLFFPLNDGKSPLFIWILVPFQLLFQDPLWAGRFLSVCLGFAQVLLNGYLVKVLGGKAKAQWLAMIMTTILPFWYFYHRQSLIDGLLTLILTAVLICTIRVVQSPLIEAFKWRQLMTLAPWGWIIALGVTVGMALLTKVPAVLMLPVLPWWILLPRHRSWKQRVTLLIYIGQGIVIGLVLFASLKVSPAFGQLFSRGSDFLYPISVILAGTWRQTLPNIFTYLGYFVSYTSILVLLLLLVSVFGRHRNQYLLLLWSAVVFSLPMAVMGKVVYARYFMPVMIFITTAVALYVAELETRYIEHSHSLKTKVTLSLVLVLLIANSAASSISFMAVAISNPSLLPLTKSDRAQYFNEWSSGHGIKEAEYFIRQQAQTQTVAVATEGYFGTLPDGLQMYFTAQPDPNVFIEGIGQPVRGISEFFNQRAAGYDKKYLLVNSHRMLMNLPVEKLVLQVCRPDNAPCLQVWDLTSP